MKGSFGEVARGRTMAEFLPPFNNPHLHPSNGRKSKPLLLLHYEAPQTHRQILFPFQKAPLQPLQIRAPFLRLRLILLPDQRLTASPAPPPLRRMVRLLRHPHRLPQGTGSSTRPHRRRTPQRGRAQDDDEPSRQSRPALPLRTARYVWNLRRRPRRENHGGGAF